MLTSVFLFSCCSDDKDSCPGEEHTVSDFTADELGKVPYTGNDTLKFLDQDGDTNIVVGTGKQFYYDNETVSGARPPDCPQNKTKASQAYKIEFRPVKGNFSFDFIQQKKGGYIYIKKYPSINFSIEYSLIGVKLTYEDKSFYDSIQVNNRTFYNARKAVSISTHNNVDKDTTYQCYYNQSYGILRITSVKENEDYSIMD